DLGSVVRPGSKIVTTLEFRVVPVVARPQGITKLSLFQHLSRFSAELVGCHFDDGVLKLLQFGVVLVPEKGEGVLVVFAFLHGFLRAEDKGVGGGAGGSYDLHLSTSQCSKVK